jgi:urease gamma subunit
VELKLLPPERGKKNNRGVPTILIITEIIAAGVRMGNLVQEMMSLKTKIEIKDIDLGQNLITKEDLQIEIAKTLKTGIRANKKLSPKVALALNRLRQNPKKLINQN